MELNIFDKNIAFGLLPFETIYYREGKAQFLREHYLRFKRACRILKIDFEYGFLEFSSSINLYIEGTMTPEGVIKLTIYNNKLQLNHREANYKNEIYGRGLTLIISKATRDRSNILNYLKTYNYGINYIEEQRAKDKGYDNVLFLNNDNNVCETSNANIFFRSGNILFTPQLRSGILNGVMRGQVIKEVRAMGFDIKKTDIGAEEINRFEECFITNSVAGVFPVKSINNYSFDSRRLADELNKLSNFERPWHK